ncbi:hypothetical protein [Aquibacillus kalidii]|uniref:hypothetical protein n=1 Tax=Aquibacillus kalidii TaxID=2762597 RepID=UPI001646BF82|nr:hypothetical protein [Aquibacillus kalidii]
MFKKVSLIMLIVLLAFLPAFTVSAATQVSSEDQSQEQEATSSNELELLDVGQTEGLVEEPEEVLVTEEAQAEVTKAAEAEAEAVVTEEAEADVEATEESESLVNEDAEITTSAEENTTVLAEENEPNPDSKATDANAAEEAENAEIPTVEEEALNLEEIYGTADGSIHYDFNKNYYVLSLKAGLNNFSENQELKQKWVAFALPNGVYIPDNEDVPAGVVPVTLYDGHTGIAVKIPDVGTFPDSKYIDITIPLMGQVEEGYNSPNENLYIYNVDTEARTVEDLGQIKNTRNIDFTVIDGQPELDMVGSINGTTTYNKENRNYDLALDVSITSNQDQEINDKYVGFILPEGVSVTDDTIEGVELLELENDKKAIAIALSTIKKGENKYNFNIPLIGKTDGNVSDKGLTLYTIDANPITGGFYVTGEVDGEANIDYSAMNQDWYFDGQAQILKGASSLNLSENQFEMKLRFELQNLTLNDVDQVKIEYIVPDSITIFEPDEYVNVPGAVDDTLDQEWSGIGGDLDVEWNGNTATVLLDDLQGTEINVGYFQTVIGSDKAIQDLEKMSVRMTLFANGNEEVKEISIPFEFVSDGENDDEDNDNGNNDGDNDSGNGDEGTGNNNDAGNEDEGSGSNNDSGNGNEGTSSNNDSSDDEGTADNNSSSESSEGGNTLPETGSFFSATFWQLLGAFMLVLGGLVYRVSRINKA